VLEGNSGFTDPNVRQLRLCKANATSRLLNYQYAALLVRALMRASSIR
jgi:hypothetical protein